VIRSRSKRLKTLLLLFDEKEDPSKRLSKRRRIERLPLEDSWDSESESHPNRRRNIRMELK
jgi:hypothetical protein